MEDSSDTFIIKQSFGGKLDAAALSALRAVAHRHTYPAQTVLFRQGERGHTFYIIVSGRVAVVQTLADGAERVLSLMGPGEYFGEMGLIDDAPRMATCTTLTETAVLEITEEVFDRLTGENPSVAYNMMRQILQRARHLDQLSIQELRHKNEALRQAYADLQATQARLVEQKRLERELELAAQVQRNLLPGALPQFPDYQFAAFLHPARYVGGDFYDVIPLDEAHVGLLIADVADKGFHAALVMAMARTLFLEASRHMLTQPVQVALDVHRGMQDVAPSSDAFVTAFYGVLHRPSGLLRYVRAGQERPLLLRPGQPITPLPGGGRFLGMFNPLMLEEYRVQLLPGDRLVLYSDGVTDAANPDGEHYGLARLTAVLQEQPHLPPAQLIEHILHHIARWQQNAPNFDDLTLLVLAASEQD